jgi:hypothetical protein
VAVVVVQEFQVQRMVAVVVLVVLELAMLCLLLQERLIKLPLALEVLHRQMEIILYLSQ